MKRYFSRFGIVVAALLCCAMQVVAFQPQETKPPEGGTGDQTGTPPPSDPFFRKPKPTTKAPEVKKANEPVLVPFPTLAERQADYQRNKEAARQRNLPEPDPIGQYLVSELTVTGVFQTDNGVGAFVQANPTSTTFFVGPGTRVYNGDIKAINTGTNFDLGAVVFRETTKYKIRNKTDSKTVEVVKPVTGGGKKK